MPWDLIFYGAMAVIFLGIMAASARARRERSDGSERPGRTTPRNGDRKSGDS